MTRGVLGPAFKSDTSYIWAQVWQWCAAGSKNGKASTNQFIWHACIYSCTVLIHCRSKQPLCLRRGWIFHPSIHLSTQQLHSCHFGSNALSTPPLEMQQGCCRHCAAADARSHKKGRVNLPPVLIINPLKLKTVFQERRESAREYKTLHTKQRTGLQAGHAPKSRMHVLDIYSAAAARNPLSLFPWHIKSPPVELSHSI